MSQRFILYEMLFPNGKRYWGMTGQSVKGRFRVHKSQARYGKSPVNRALRKYKSDVKVFTRIVGDRSFIASMEIAAIAAYNSTDGRFGYNVLFGGISGARQKQTKIVVSRRSHSAAMADPNTRKHIREGLSRPGVIDKMIAGIRAAAKSNPKMWITDGLNNRKISINDSIPEGWYRGKVYLNSPGLGLANKSNAFARDLDAIFDDIRSCGITSYGSMARELNARRISTINGKLWFPNTVRNVVLRQIKNAGT